MKLSTLFVALCLMLGCAVKMKDPAFVVEGVVAQRDSSSVAIRIPDGTILNYQLDYPHPDLNLLMCPNDHIQLALALAHNEYEQGREWDFRWLKNLSERGPMDSYTDCAERRWR